MLTGTGGAADEGFGGTTAAGTGVGVSWNAGTGWEASAAEVQSGRLRELSGPQASLGPEQAMARRARSAAQGSAEGRVV